MIGLLSSSLLLLLLLLVVLGNVSKSLALNGACAIGEQSLASSGTFVSGTSNGEPLDASEVSVLFDGRVNLCGPHADFASCVLCESFGCSMSLVFQFATTAQVMSIDVMTAFASFTSVDIRIDGVSAWSGAWLHGSAVLSEWGTVPLAYPIRARTIQFVFLNGRYVDAFGNAGGGVDEIAVCGRTDGGSAEPATAGGSVTSGQNAILTTIPAATGVDSAGADSADGGIVAAAVIGALVGLALIAGIAIYFIRNRRHVTPGASATADKPTGEFRSARASIRTEADAEPSPSTCKRVESSTKKHERGVCAGCNKIAYGKTKCGVCVLKYCDECARNGAVFIATPPRCAFH